MLFPNTRVPKAALGQLENQVASLNKKHPPFVRFVVETSRPPLWGASPPIPAREACPAACETRKHGWASQPCHPSDSALPPPVTQPCHPCGTHPATRSGLGFSSWAATNRGLLYVASRLMRIADSAETRDRADSAPAGSQVANAACWLE